MSVQPSHPRDLGDGDGDDVTRSAPVVSRANMILMNNMPPSVILRLTPRLIEILHFVSHGATNAQIGKILHISEDTVKVHIRRLLRALDARNRAHIVRRGFEYGLLEKGSETA